MTISTEFRGKISGPNHLMDLLGRNLIPLPVDYEMRLIRLDENRRIFDTVELKNNYAANIANSIDMPENGFGILIGFVPDDLDTDVAVEFAQKLEQAQFSNLFVLDRLIVNPQYWRSVICSNAECCPAAGRTRPQLNETQQLFNELVAASESNGFVSRSAFTSFENIRIRDGFLVHLSAPEHSYRLQKWNQILLQTDVKSEPELEAIRQTLLSIIAYLKEELPSAKVHISIALQLYETYSLGKLVNRALESEAPASLIRDAFQAVTYEKLDLEPPK